MGRFTKPVDTLTRKERRPGKARQMRRIRFFRCALIGVVLLSGGILAARLWEYSTARLEYQSYQDATVLPEATEAAETTESLEASRPTMTQAAQAAAQPQETPVPTPRPYRNEKVVSLKRQNLDMKAWLGIPGTKVQYPVVQTDNNDYYLTRTFQRKKNASGAIFIDCWNDPAFRDFNTVIYGHNMKDGSMFASIYDYRKQNFADSHLTIEVALENKLFRYKVFAAYVAKDSTSIDFRGQTAFTDEEKRAFILAARKRATIDSHATVRVTDRLLTLVTCTSGEHDWHFVVHAVLVEEVDSVEYVSRSQNSLSERLTP